MQPKYLFYLMLFVFLISCNETPTNNTGDVLPITLMQNGFESNDQPTLTGWRDNDSLITERRRFTDDVPVNGGKWSIQIFPPHNNNCMSMTYSVYPLQKAQLNNYKLTFWRKTSEGDPNSSVWLNVYYNGSSSGKGRGVSTASDWYKDSILYTSQNDVLIDSIQIIINGCSKTPQRPDSLNNIFYDQIKMEQY